MLQRYSNTKLCYYMLVKVLLDLLVTHIFTVLILDVTAV
jgi:hypothetical protein